MMTAPSSPPYYWDYLRLDLLLGAQQPESARRGEVAHDEMLFIVVHQAFELWFKQILWELDSVLAALGGPSLDDERMGETVGRLARIVEIQPLLLAQLHVLETMTPLDFLDFRDHLVPASGFQSVQFRLIENKLGIDQQRRPLVRDAPYTAVLSPEHVALLRRTETEPTLLELVEGWLERTPFLHFGGFDFWRFYRSAVEGMLDEEGASAQRRDTFAALFDRQRWDGLRAEGVRRLSRDAFLAALLISLYRDAPIFQLPFRLLTALAEIDEGFTAWRQRHALMVHRMIGGRVGTGGSSGVGYLEETVQRSQVFTDLFDLPTFLLPRSKLPVLPEQVREQLGFRYAGTQG